MIRKTVLLFTFLTFTAVHTGKSQITTVMPPETPDDAIQKLYHALTYDHDTMPDWKLLRSLFLEDALLIHAIDTAYQKMDIDEFIERFKKQINSGNLLQFRESEINRKRDSYAGIYHAFSTYSATIESTDGTDTVRGVNSIQLIRKDGGWFITSILWFDETDKYALPDEYLPPQNR